jgi:hypothetical protein
LIKSVLSQLHPFESGGKFVGSVFHV